MAALTKSDFDEFLLKEYENIATAHFESQKQFALFFRYYTLFFSIPIVIVSLSDASENMISKCEFGWLLIILSFIGVFFFIYAINLKHEAVLYARTVNGIRRHFYQKIPSAKQSEMRTLPIDIRKPSFLSRHNPVLIIMALGNILYLNFGLYKLDKHSIEFFFISAIGLYIAHVLLNDILSHYQTKTYNRP